MRKLYLLTAAVSIAALMSVGCAPNGSEVADGPVFTIQGTPAPERAHENTPPPAHQDHAPPAARYPLKIAKTPAGLRVAMLGDNGVFQKLDLPVHLDTEGSSAYITLRIEGDGEQNRDVILAAEQEFLELHPTLEVASSKPDVTENGILYTGYQTSKPMLAGVRLELNERSRTVSPTADPTEFVNWVGGSRLYTIPQPAAAPSYNLESVAGTRDLVNIRFENVQYTPAVREAFAQLTAEVLRAGGEPPQLEQLERPEVDETDYRD